MKPFTAAYQAEAWLHENAKGDCTVLTPNKRWLWYHYRKEIIFLRKIK